MTASFDTYVEGKRQARLGDALVPYGFIRGGSRSQFVNGRPAARYKDPATCKIIYITYSRRHFIGD